MEFRETILPSGTKILLGKDAESNDNLMKKFRGQKNIILHTSSPGSPFCVIVENLNPSKEEIKISGTYCARYSQDWRDNKKDIKVNVFTGKDIRKSFWAKKGTWKVKMGKSKTIKIKKLDVLKLEKKGGR